MLQTLSLSLKHIVIVTLEGAKIVKCQKNNMP